VCTVLYETEVVNVEAASAYAMSNQLGRRVGPCHACVQVEAVLIHLAGAVGAAHKATEHRQAVVCLYTPINGATVAPARRYRRHYRRRRGRSTRRSVAVGCRCRVAAE
jgi:hypothetical protein